MRLNSEGIPREHLLIALRDRRVVQAARYINSCLLCRRREVNEAGLCEVCWGMLEGEEIRMGERWMRGEGP